MAKPPSQSKTGAPKLQSDNAFSDKKIESLVVPSALGAEKSLLSLMLKDPVNYVGKAVETGVSENFFYFSGHKVLWNLLLARFEKGLPTDLTSVNQALQDAGSLEALGGVAGLAELYSYDTLGAYFDHHTELLREKHILRSIINVGNEAVIRAYTGDEEVKELLDNVEQEVLAIREGNEKKDTVTLKSIIQQAVNNIENFIASKGIVQGLKTGFPMLDSKTNGLKGGDMFVVAARPSMGKTSFLLNIIEEIAVNQGKPALMFSCEMPSVQLVERLLFAHSGLQKSKVMEDNGLDKEDMLRFQKSTLALKKSGLTLDDTASITINELRAKARRVKREKGLSVIGIDYLQLMRSYSKQAQNSREREIAEISAGLKALAKELDVPVVVLAQLNRGPENRTGNSLGVPRMSDLRESGAIEQDADMIGLLYRLSYYSENKGKEEENQDDKGKAFLDLAKNRNGPTGRVPLTVSPELMRFIPRDFAPGEDAD